MAKPQDVSTWPYMFSDDIRFVQKAIVHHPKGKRFFLALKRSEDSFTRPGDWDLPGGSVLFGELHEAAIRREITEESGVEVGDLSLVDLYTRLEEKDGLEIYSIYVSYKTTSRQTVVTLSEEHTEFQWVSLEEFEDLCEAEYLKNIARKAYAQDV